MTFFADKFRGKGNSMYLLFIHAISISNDKEIKETGSAEENTDFSIKVPFHGFNTFSSAIAEIVRTPYI